MDKNYYVYIYLDPRKSGKYCYKNICFIYQPIYVGKGKDNRISSKHNHNKYLSNKINKIKKFGLELIKIKILDNISEDVAFEYEIKYIEEIGRYDLQKGFLTNNTNGGEGCNGRGFTIKFVKNYVNNNDIELLSTEYFNIHQSLYFKCKICSHIWKTTFGHIYYHGSGCPKCYGNVKYTIDYVKKYIHEKKIKLNSKEYKNNRQILEFECEICNHVWNTNFNNIHNHNSGCPKCYGNAKYTIEYVKKYMHEKKIKLKSNIYTNNHQKLELECETCNHVWNTNFGNIHNQKTGCPRCIGKAKYSIDYIRNIMNKNGFILLSNYYKNNLTKLKLRCKACNNIRYINFNNFQTRLKNNKLICNYSECKKKK